jgi:hypothetical protein
MKAGTRTYGPSPVIRRERAGGVQVSGQALSEPSGRDQSRPPAQPAMEAEAAGVIAELLRCRLPSPPVVGEGEGEGDGLCSV